MLKLIGWIVSCVLLLLLWQSQAPAQSVSALQSELFDLRLQVNQLRSEVYQLSQQRQSGGLPPPLPPPTTTSPSKRQPTDRQMLERLATLAVEAKERIRTLEGQVSQLQDQINACRCPKSTN
jgi:predicted  nucleic acid-binding Zn-ribbon protein